MELKDFVANTISEIIEGLVEAQDRVKSHGAFINPGNLMRATKEIGETALWDNRNNNYARSIAFDVALTVEEGTNTSGRVGVVAGIFNLGTGGSSENKQLAISRVQFTIPILFPANDLPEEAGKTKWSK